MLNFMGLITLIIANQIKVRISDYICYLSETLYNSNSLIRFDAQATLFKTCLSTTFAATSKIFCLIKFAYPTKFVQSLGLLTFAS